MRLASSGSPNTTSSLGSTMLKNNTSAAAATRNAGQKIQITVLPGCIGHSSNLAVRSSLAIDARLQHKLGLRRIKRASQSPVLLQIFEAHIPAHGLSELHPPL